MLIVVILTRHTIATAAVRWIAGTVLQTEVTIDSLRVGPREIRLTGLTVYEPAMEAAPQLGIGEVVVVPSIWRGIRHGVWAESIVVSRVRLDVRFDDAGRLISRLPAGGETSDQPDAPSIPTLPMGRLSVDDVAVVIHHGSRQTRPLVGGSVRGQFDDQITLAASAAQWFGGELAFDAALDASDLGGHTSLRITDCRFDFASLLGGLLPAVAANQRPMATGQLRCVTHHRGGWLSRLSDLSMHKIDMTALLGNVRCRDGGRIASQCRCTVDHDDGGTVVSLAGDPVGGRIALEARVDPWSMVSADDPSAAPVQARVRGRVDLAMDELLRRFAPEVPAAGRVKVALDAVAGLDGGDASWSATMQCIASELSHDGRQLPEVTVAATSNGNILGGQSPVGTVDGTVSTTPMLLSTIDPSLAGQSDVRGEFHLDAATMRWNAGGIAEIRGPRVGAMALGDATVRVSAVPDRCVVTADSPDLWGGSVRGTATMTAFDPQTTEVNLKLTDLDVSRLIKLSGQRIDATGRVSADVHLGGITAVDSIVADAKITTRGVSVGGIAVQCDRAEVRVGDMAADVEIAARTLGGEVSLAAATRIVPLMEFAKTKSMDLGKLPVTIRGDVRQISLRRLMASMPATRQTRIVDGSVSASLVRDAAAIGDGLLCRARATLDSLSLRRARVTDRITASLRVSPTTLFLDSITGRLAGGAVGGRGQLSMPGGGSPPRGWVRLTANRVDLQTAAAPAGRVAGSVSGHGSVKIDAKIGRRVTGRALVTALHPSACGLNVRATRLPIDWSFDVGSGRSSWRMRSGLVDAGHGKIHLSTAGQYDRSLTMQLTADLDRIETAKLTRGGGVDAGTIDGVVRLAAKRARAIDDLTGRFDVRLSQIESMRLPVMSDLQKFLGGIGRMDGRRRGQDHGRLRGRLSGGLVHVEELAITQSGVSVLIDGTATTAGRLNLEVTAATGSVGPADGVTALVDSPLMLAAPAPVALLVKANQAMKDRVVHVHVGGTASRPMLRLQPGKQLTQDAVRFFLMSQFGAGVAAISRRGSGASDRNRF